MSFVSHSVVHDASLGLSKLSWYWLASQRVGRGWPSRLQAVHGMPFVEAWAVWLDALLIVADPLVCQATQEIVVVARLRAHLVQSLQRWPATNNKTTVSFNLIPKFKIGKTNITHIQYSSTVQHFMIIWLHQNVEWPFLILAAVQV